MKVFDENVKANHLFMAILKLTTQIAIEDTKISQMFCKFSDYFFYASMLVAFKKYAPDAISILNIKIESEQLNLTVLEEVEKLIINKFSQNLITPLIILEEISEIINGESEQTLSEELISSINTLFGFSLNDWEISQKYSLFTLSINSIIAALSMSYSDQKYLIFVKELINYYFSDKVDNLKECNLEFVHMMGDIEDSIETN